MKKRIAIVSVFVAVACVVSIAILAHRHKQKRKREDIEKIADAIQQYSTGKGWELPPPIETIAQSNIVIDGGVVEISEEEYIRTLSPHEQQEENRKRIERMTLIDDRPKGKTTEQSPGGDSLKAAPQE